MVIINNVNIISESSLEAEIIVTDGINELICFSQPCKLIANQRLTEQLYCFNNKNLIRSNCQEYYIEKLKEPLAYNLIGKLIDKKNNLVIVGEIVLKLEEASIPKDILENEYVSFYCQRIDIY